MELPVKNTQGEMVGTVEVSDALFNVPMNNTLVQQALVMHQANSRQGTSSTKTRGMVSGGGKKPYAQKHTGRARQGSTRAPHYIGGGVVFGPHPRSYHQRMPKTMHRKALRCVLSAKARDERLLLLETLDLPEVKTKGVVRLLGNLGITSPVLMVTLQGNRELVLSARNIGRVKTLSASLLNVADLLKYDRLVMTVDAIRKAEELWASTRTRSRKMVPDQA